MTTELDTSEEQEGVRIGQQLLLVSFILLLIFGTAITPRLISGIKGTQDNAPASIPYTTTDIEKTPTAAPIDPFSNVETIAEMVYVWDVQNQRVLYKENESEVVPLASVTKLMTALLAHEILPETAQIIISETAIAQDGDSGLMAGEVFDRLDLSDLVLISSSNDGAYALAEAAGSLLDADNAIPAFVGAMNVRARELALNNTTFRNPTGLDISLAEAGATGSARDMAFLMEHIIVNIPEILAYTQTEDVRIYNTDGIYHDAENTNYYTSKIPGLIGSKTGYTDLAGGNLVIAYDAGLNRPIIISVLGSTQLSRFVDVLSLVEKSNQYVTNNQ